VRDVTLLAAKPQSDAPQRQAAARPAPPAQRPSGGSIAGDPDPDIPFAPPITRRSWSVL